MTAANATEMREKHVVLAEFFYEPVTLEKGYASRALRVDVSEKTISIIPVTQKMKDLWVGGKGLDLWLMFQEINKDTKWNSPENPICFSSGPLGGTKSFPGSGKTLVTSVSPTTHSIIDSNVGGYFGPFLKFAGFDALVILGKATQETIVYIDATKRRVTIETAPLESIDSHLAAEEFTEMYADNEEDRRNIAVVSAGRAADHVLLGMLNFSFFDWRRQVARLKQAGRGGIGTVFRDKKLKALVLKNKDYDPTWKIADSKISEMMKPKLDKEPEPDLEGIRAIIAKWKNAPEYLMEMMQDIQNLERYISKTAIAEINRLTGIPKSEIYHIASFYSMFSLEPKGKIQIQVCMGAACHIKGGAQILEAFENELGIKQGGTTPDAAYSLDAVGCLGCCSLAPVVRIGDELLGNIQVKDVPRIVKEKRGE